MNEFKVRKAVLKNGEEITGMIVPIYPAKVLLQTDEICLELSETDIQSLDGKKDFRSLIKPYDRATFEAMIIHQYNEDGSSVSLNKMRLVNTSDQVLGRVRFMHTSSGSMTKELEEQFNRSEHFDVFGHLLPVTIDERLENGWKYSVELPIPVAPGEAYEITCKETWSKWAEREGDHWVARHYSSCTGDAIYTLMLILPRGAEFSSATPQPLRQFDFNGKPTVTWKRYMLRSEAVTFEATYKL